MYDNIKLDKYGCRKMEMRRFIYHNTRAAEAAAAAATWKLPKSKNCIQPAAEFA